MYTLITNYETDSYKGTVTFHVEFVSWVAGILEPT